MANYVNTRLNAEEYVKLKEALKAELAQRGGNPNATYTTLATEEWGNDENDKALNPPTSDEETITRHYNYLLGIYHRLRTNDTAAIEDIDVNKVAFSEDEYNQLVNFLNNTSTYRTTEPDINTTDTTYRNINTGCTSGSCTGLCYDSCYTGCTGCSSSCKQNCEVTCGIDCTGNCDTKCSSKIGRAHV